MLIDYMLFEIVAHMPHICVKKRSGTDMLIHEGGITLLNDACHRKKTGEGSGNKYTARG